MQGDVTNLTRSLLCLRSCLTCFTTNISTTGLRTRTINSSSTPSYSDKYHCCTYLTMLGHSILKLGATAALLVSSVSYAAPTEVADYDAEHFKTSVLKRATGPSTSSSADLRTTILNVHNAHRSNHHAPALTWDEGLASYAQKWVNKCVFQHSVSPCSHIYSCYSGPDRECRADRTARICTRSCRDLLAPGARRLLTD